jgi:hypothetical protein
MSKWEIDHHISNGNSNSESHLDSHDTAMSISYLQIVSVEWEHLKDLNDLKDLKELNDLKELLIQTLICSIDRSCKIDAIANFHHNDQPIEKQSWPNVLNSILQMGNVQQIVKCLHLKQIEVQYNSNIQNIPIRDQSMCAKVNLHLKLKVKEMKEVNEEFVSTNFEVHLLNMN